MLKCSVKGDFMTRESKYAIFKYKKIDEDLIDDLASYLDEHGHIPFDFFEVEVPKDKVVIEIVPTKKEYDEKYKKDRQLPDDFPLGTWNVGSSFFKMRKILFLSPRDYKNTTHYMKDVPYPELINHWHKTVVHEFTHYVQGLFNIKHNCASTMKFLGEGIATYLSGQREGQKIKFDFTFDNLWGNEKFSYVASYLVTKYLVEHYDKDYVLEVFQSNRQARELLQNELYDKAKQFYNGQSNS